MASSTDILTTIAVIFSFGIVLAVLAHRFVGRYLPMPHRLNVPPFKTGVILLRDKPVRTVPTGTYWLSPHSTILTCDTRSTPLKLAPEEFLTADNFGLRISLTGHYRITDPTAFVTTSSNATGAFFLELTQSLRESTQEFSGHNPAFARTALPARIQQLVAPRAARLGITVDSLEIAEYVPLGWLKSATPQTPAPPPTTQGFGPN